MSRTSGGFLTNHFTTGQGLQLCLSASTIRSVIQIERISVEEAGRRTSDAPNISLDGAGTDSPWDRWSYHLFTAILMLQCDGRTRITTLHSAARRERQWTNPLDAFAWLA